MLSDLLTYSSFEDFSMMMNRAFQNVDFNPRIKQDILEVTNKSIACCLSIAQHFIHSESVALIPIELSC